MLARIAFLACCLVPSVRAANVIFIHPDGAGVAHWQAARFYWAGPDAELNWDRIPHIAIYRGHMRDSLTATSNGGATSHAYGVKVPSAAFGTDGTDTRHAVAGNGARGSLMHEAIARGIRVGIVNSGSIYEPGTACFLASVAKRDDGAAIARQIVESGADVILSGGEEWFLPEGKAGRHTAAGRRGDGLDLADAAKSRGYTVVYDLEELEALPPGTKKLLGIFSDAHTFNDVGEREMSERGLPTFKPGAPTVAEMTAAALKILSPGPFFLVVEEEGIDNFGNCNNALGALDALKRADDALGVALAFVEKNPPTLLITAADSTAGNMDVIGSTPEKLALLPAGRDKNGAPYSAAPGGKPFFSQPDRAGIKHPFVISWGTLSDSSGGIVVRAAGKNSDEVNGSFDNTKIYEVMRRTLFDTP